VGPIQDEVRIAYGPVPSRRLGRSIGINNIPPKHCSYSCVYCQLGRTRVTEVLRRRFYTKDRVLGDVRAQVELVEGPGGTIDHLTFVPDGEPTLDIDLGEEIRAVKDLGYPVAVITNSSLMDREEVRGDLANADLVSVKVDSVDEAVWRALNRPHGKLSLDRIMDGLREFSKTFKGSLITETKMVRDVNDDPDGVKDTARFVMDLSPNIAYITVPIRPTAQERAGIPEDRTVRMAVSEFARCGLRTVALTEGEIGEFAYTGDLKGDLLAITSVHPMREDSVRDMVDISQGSWKLVEKMVGSGDLTVHEREGIMYYRRGEGA